MQLAWLNIFHYTYYNMLSPRSNFSLLCAPRYGSNLVTVWRLQQANMYVDVDVNFQKIVISDTMVVHENRCPTTVSAVTYYAAKESSKDSYFLVE